MSAVRHKRSLVASSCHVTIQADTPLSKMGHRRNCHRICVRQAVVGQHLVSAGQGLCPQQRPEQWVPGRPVQTRGCIEHTSISFLLHKLLCIQKWRREQKLFFSQSLTRKLMGTDGITASSKHCHLFAKRSYRCSKGFASARLYLS